MNVKKVIKTKFPRSYKLIKYAGKYTTVFFQHVIHKKRVKTRDDLPFLLNILGFIGPNSEGVEIGTWKGYHSAHILEISELSILYSIDPWQHFSDRVYTDADNVSQEEFEVVHDHAVRILEKFGKRSRIMRMGSLEASRAVADNTLDFIYIDANHSYERCKEDLELWWPKLKKGGLFAGHDYLDGDLPQGKFGVKSAVNEFLKADLQKLFVTPEAWPTWYLIKQ
jgi:predicted O-methyltransferase YrrM